MDMQSLSCSRVRGWCSGAGGKVTSGEGDWDGGSRPDAHTTEVASLKRRLVASERARIELATQVAAERRAVLLQLTNSQRTGEAVRALDLACFGAEVAVLALSMTP